MVRRTAFLFAFGLVSLLPALDRTADAQAAIQFDPPVVKFIPGRAPLALITADFNHDGKLDVAESDPVSDRILVLLGGGNGTLNGGTATLGSIVGVSGLAAGDVNHDGHIDLVVGTQKSAHPLLVFLGHGDGTFAPAASYAAPGAVGRLLLVDLNADGFLDVAAPFQGAPNGIATFLNDTTGGFGPATTFATGLNGNDIAAADFNGDGKLDLAVASFTGASTGVFVFAGLGNGTFGPMTTLSTVAASNVAAGDITGDGRADLVVSLRAFMQPPQTGFITFIGNGNGAFQAGPAFGAGLPLGFVAIADLNHDGVADVAAGSGGNTVTFMGDVETGFGSPTIFPNNGGPLVALGDLNNDGKPDAISLGGGNTDITTLLNSTPATALGPGAGIAWTNAVNVAVNGTTIQKNGGCDGCWDASAASTQHIDGTADSGVEAMFQTTGLVAMGLATASGATSLDAIDFALRPQGSFMEVRERGVYRTDIAFGPADKFRILVQSNVVRYLKNGAPFYVSQMAPGYPMYVAGAIATAGATIDDASIFGASGSGGGGGGGGGGGTTWGGGTHVTVSGDSIAKTGGCDGCYDAWTTSDDRITTGVGFFEFTVDNAGPLLTAGLTTSFDTPDPSNIDFGIRVQGGDAEVRERGVYQTDVLFQAGDVFRITVSGGVVTYALNGTTFYTSTAVPGSPLMAVIDFASAGGSVSDATIGGS